MQKLQTIFVACALAFAASVAQAGITPGWTGNPSLNLIAFNVMTGAWYIRDTGFLMNDFLPNNVTTRPGDGGVTGDKTPDTGLLLDKHNTPNFSDSAFSVWLTGQNVDDVRWMLSAADARGSLSTDVRRLITSSSRPDLYVTNVRVDVYTTSGNAGRLDAFAGDFGLSIFSQTGAPASFSSNFGLGASTLASLDQSVSLFYVSRTTPAGSSGALAERSQYANESGYATVTLESDGDFVYELAGVPSAVPVPAAAWLLGSGLMGLLGLSRRRKAFKAVPAASC